MLSVLAYITAGGMVVAQQSSFRPDLIQESDITVEVKKVGEMPFVLGPGFFGPAPNLASPVPVRNRLLLIDQNDAIYRFKFRGRKVKKIFGVEEAPDGLTLDNRHSILNVSEGRTRRSLFVMFTSATLPTAEIPVYILPDPLADVCCDLLSPIPVDDLYRLGSTVNGIETRTEFQVLYEYRLRNNRLTNPRAIAAIEMQSGPTQHNGGGMLTAPDGRVLFATGDAISSGAEGRSAPQDDIEAVGKILLIDPDDGSVEVAAKGLRNVQRMDYVQDYYLRSFVGFVDIGGVTAEEVNYVSIEDLLDTSVIENFGWGRNADGLAREGTFYVGPGVPLVGVTEPPAVGFAPIPEVGFIQPQAQYGRNDPNGGDPNGGAAISGPVSTAASFDRISALFSDLASGILYATTEDFSETNATVFRVNMVNENGEPIDTLRDFRDGQRVDPRFFRFPNGAAGVLLERTGEFFRLTEIEEDDDY